MRKRRAVVVVVSFLAAALGASHAVAALPDSLPSVASGARPGPDVLYAPAPAAPQLENRNARFSAPPLLVSGQEAYVDGEYLYQDFLYDDHGSDTDASGGVPLTARAGDIKYPTNVARYANNAADLVELRIAVTPTDVAYRITLNALLAADSTIVALAFDADSNALTGGATLPRDPGAPFPGTDEVITVWGTGAEHTRFPLVGLPVTTALAGITTDLEANQITVIVPRSVSDPHGTWRATLATGLYDTATGGWLKPQLSATATLPGGAGPADLMPAGIFNLGFRFNEQFVTCPGAPAVPPCDVPPDTSQSAAIRSKTPTTFAHDIDFDKLDNHVNESTVPAAGLQIRIFPSRLDLGEGRGDLGAGALDFGPFPQYLGQLQPYSLYIPTTYSAATPAGLTLNLHSLGEQYWQYHKATMVQQIGEVRGNLVATTLSRGPDGWYQDEAEYDVFEVWNDVAAHFTLDPDRVASSGYSMGGYATYRLPTLYPDLFGKAFTQVGPPGDGVWVPPGPPTGGIETLTNLWLENARNIPYLNVAASSDQLVPIAGPRAQNLGAPEFGIRGFDQLGYRFRFLIFSPSDHFAQALNGYNYPFAPDFLGDASVDRDPSHVTFAYVPAADNDDLGLVHDHGYWVSEVQVADIDAPPAPGKGVVDAFSHGFGLGDPPSTAGATAGAVPPFTYEEFNRTWGPAPAIPVANILDVTLTNVGSAHLDVARAALDPAASMTVNVDADHAGTLHLDGAFPGCTTVFENDVPLPGSATVAAGVSIPVVAGTHVYMLECSDTETFELRKVVITRPDTGLDKLVLKARITALLSQLGLPGNAITITLADVDGTFYSATVPAGSLIPNRSGTKLRFRDRSGTVANGITSLSIGGKKRTDLSLRARNINLSGAMTGPFTATLEIGSQTLSAGGVFRARGNKLIHP